MFQRDYERIDDLQKRVDVCPLGRFEAFDNTYLDTPKVSYIVIDAVSRIREHLLTQ